MIAVTKDTPALQRMMRFLWRKVSSSTETLCAPLSERYRFAFCTKISSDSFLALPGVMSAPIKRLRKEWRKTIGKTHEYAAAHSEELTEYGRLMLLEFPKLLDAAEAALVSNVGQVFSDSIANPS